MNYSSILTVGYCNQIMTFSNYIYIWKVAWHSGKSLWLERVYGLQKSNLFALSLYFIIFKMNKPMSTLHDYFRDERKYILNILDNS